MWGPHPHVAFFVCFGLARSGLCVFHPSKQWAAAMALDDDAIEELATAAQVTESDGVKVQERPLPEVIEAQKYLDGKTAARKKHRGLRFTKLIPPGSV